MRKTFTFLAVAALTAGSTLAFAQSSKTSFADAFGNLQALSSNSSQWQIDQGPMIVDRGPTFAQTHPQGLSFVEYQALASNSGEFQISGDGATSSFASEAAPRDAMGARTTVLDRWARLFHRTY